MLEELINRLPHAGPILRNDNKSFFMMISKAINGTSVESTINPTQYVNMAGWHSLRLFQTTRVILNIKLLLNIEVTFYITSSEMDIITLWSRMFQITGPILRISVTVPLTLATLSLILLKG